MKHCDTVFQTDALSVRFLCLKSFFFRSDPLVDELFHRVQSAKESNGQLVKYLKDRAKVCSELASRLRSTYCSLNKTLRHGIQPSSILSVGPDGDPVKVRNKIKWVGLWMFSTLKNHNGRNS